MTAVGLSPSLPAAPHFALWGRSIRVIVPSRRDARLRLAVVIISLQVLGQTVLGFKVSIAQILVTIGVCAILETVVLVWRDRILTWPASAMLTGNSVSFILRTPGTRHGDWWSLNGVEWFIAAALLSLLSKYLVRPSGRHIFNPSNVGLVAVLLIGGVANVFPQYLWWGPLDLPVGLALGVILLGAIWVLRPVRMIPMAVAFWLTFAGAVAILALSGRCFVAIWHPGAICGGSYWLDITTSPELLVFVFFMMSDPMTAPKSATGRLVYGSATAIVGAALLAMQPSEFGVKLAILASLTLVCGLVPFIELVSRRLEERQPVFERGLPVEGLGRRLAMAALSPAIVASAIIAISAPVDTALLAGNQQVIAVDLGLAGRQ
jgi:Na+-translocating ferredoxin:NAD+ oxidoreductase RnfD subunit